MTNIEYKKWLTIESLLAQTLKAFIQTEVLVQQTFNAFKAGSICLQFPEYDFDWIINNFKNTFGLIKVMEIVVKNELEALSREQSLEESSKSEDRFVTAQQNISPLGCAKKLDTDFKNLSKVNANVNDESKFDLEIDDSMVSIDVNHLLNSKISPVRQQVSEIQNQFQALKNDLESTNKNNSNSFANQLKDLQKEISKLKAERGLLFTELNLAKSGHIHLEKELKSIKEAKLQSQTESNIEKNLKLDTKNERRPENLKLEGKTLNGPINLSLQMEEYRENLKKKLTFTHEGSKKIEWLQLSSDLLFKSHTTAPFVNFGLNAVNACQNIIQKLVKSGTLISGLKIENLQAIGILDAECITLPFACCRNNKELFSRPFFVETYFIGLRFIYLKSFQQQFLTVEGDAAVETTSADFIRPGQGDWLLESIGVNNVFLSHNSKENKNVLAINDVGQVFLTTNRSRNYYEEFEMIYHPKERVVTLQRIRSPRYYLSCDENGKVSGYLHCNLLANEGWKIE